MSEISKRDTQSVRHVLGPRRHRRARLRSAALGEDAIELIEVLVEVEDYEA